MDGGGGCLWEILKTTPKKYQNPVLWAWLEMFFTPRRWQFSNNNILPDTDRGRSRFSLFEVENPKRNQKV